jgi:hypothetical protein
LPTEPLVDQRSPIAGVMPASLSRNEAVKLFGQSQATVMGSAGD